MRRDALLLTFALCAMTCQSALAQNNSGLKNIGFAVGIVSPEGLDATLGVGVFADVGAITPNVRVEPRMDFWTQSETMFGGSEFTVRDIAIGCRVKYYFPVANPKLMPFAGGGLGLHFINAEVEMIDPFSGQPISADDSSTEIGLDIGGGLATPIGVRTNFVTEAWFGAVSDFSHFTLRVGLTHAFGS